MGRIGPNQVSSLVLLLTGHSMVVELSSKLVRERLDLEQQLEDMQATHQTKMEQMSSSVK